MPNGQAQTPPAAARPRPGAARRGPLPAPLRRAALPALLPLVALLALPAAALAQDSPRDPYDAEEPAPEQRWGPSDTPDRSPDEDAAPAPPGRSSTGERRRRYSYEEDPRLDGRRPRRGRDGRDERARRERPGEEVDDGPDYPRIGIEAFAWLAGYKGVVERERLRSGTSFHPHADEFLLDDTDAGIDVRLVTAPSEDWLVEAEYGVVRFDGRSTLSSDIDFDGRFFPTGNRVDMAVQCETFQLTAEYIFLSRRHVRLGLPFGLGWFSHKTRIRDLDAHESATERVDAVSPFLGLAVDLPFGEGVGVDARVKLFGYEAGDSRDLVRFGFVDFEARFYATLAGRLRCYAGYRYLGVENEQRERYDDIEGSFRLHMAILGLGVTF